MEFKDWWAQAGTEQRLDLLNRVMKDPLIRPTDRARWAGRTTVLTLAEEGGLSHSDIRELEKAYNAEQA